MPFSPHDDDFASSDSLNCNSEELEAIIRGTMGKMVGDATDDNPPPFAVPFDESQSSYGASEVDPSLRMSFARWTAEDKKSWTCNVCTFVNEPLHLLCGVCGKAKGGKADGEDQTVQSPSNSSSLLDIPHELAADFDEDQFLEQLRQERHTEVLELQESILSQAAMEMSVREHSPPPAAARLPSPPPPQHRPPSPPPAAARLPAPAATQPSPLCTSSGTQPPPRFRPVESAVYSSTTEAEQNEMRKILSMTMIEKNCIRAARKNNDPMMMSHSSPCNLSSAPERRRRVAEVELTDSRLLDDSSSTNNPSNDSRRTTNRKPPPKVAASTFLDDNNNDVDEDLLAKIAARSHYNPRNDDLPELTSMAAAAKPAAAAARPGAYQNRPGVSVSPIRNDCPLAMATAQKPGCSSSSVTNTPPRKPPPTRTNSNDNRALAEEEKLKNDPGNKATRANSGVALDPELLQTIVNAGGVDEALQGSYNSHRSQNSNKSHPSLQASDSTKVLAGMLKKAAAKEEPSPKKGGLKKAAKGLMRGLPFRKKDKS